LVGRTVGRVLHFALVGARVLHLALVGARVLHLALVGTRVLHFTFDGLRVFLLTLVGCEVRLRFVGHIVGGSVSHFAFVGGYVASGTGFTLGDCFTDGSSVGG
jgi:hypothetical protein